jgi:hypothetical protein
MREGQHHQLLLLPLNSKGDAFEQYEFQQQPGTEENFFLSPDAGLVLIQDGPAVRLEDRGLHSSCSVSSAAARQFVTPGGFINRGQFAATRWYPADVQSNAHYEIYDQHCKPVGDWELAGGIPAMTWPVMELSSYRTLHWRQKLGDASCRVAVMEADREMVICEKRIGSRRRPGALRDVPLRPLPMSQHGDRFTTGEPDNRTLRKADVHLQIRHTCPGHRLVRSVEAVYGGRILGAREAPGSLGF